MMTGVRNRLSVGAAALLGCVGASVVADAGPDRSPGTGCKSGEQLVFGCNTGANRNVSVCASPDLSPTTGMLEYRFTRKGKIELVVPSASSSAADWRTQVKAGQVMYAGGGGAYLRFEENLHGYVVYSATGRGWGQKHGLMVVAPNGKQTVQRCQGAVKTQLGSKLAELAGLQRDTDELELPGP